MEPSLSRRGSWQEADPQRQSHLQIREPAFAKAAAREFAPHLWFGSPRFNTRGAHACRNFCLIFSEALCLRAALARGRTSITLMTRPASQPRLAEIYLPSLQVRISKMLSRAERRIGASCAVAGSVVLFVGTYLHPMQADPNQPVEAFAEYAADPLWIASHLIQLAGVALMVGALVLIARQLEMRNRTSWARIAAGGAIASLAIAAALQAVDGIALKHVVDAWARAPASEKEMLFHAAFAVRQVEVGLASMLSLSLGLTATIYGAALLADGTYPRWVSALAVIGGVTTAFAGLVIAYTGFSGFSMAVSMPGSSVLLLWMLTLGVCMWRGGTP